MSPLDDLTLLRCETDAELAEAVTLRTGLFRGRSGLDFDADSEAVRDAAAHVLLLRHGGEAVATARLAPYPSAGSSLWAFRAELGTDDIDSEVSRMAAVRSAAGLRFSLLTMVLGARWVLEVTNHRRYASYVNPALVRLYTGVGARDTGYRCDVPGRSTPYAIVTGEFEHCLRLGSAQIGLSPEHVRRHVRWDEAAEPILLSA